MHFPFYVAMWFGTTPDDALVDPDFPRRFVPRAFDCILRNNAHRLLLAPGLPRADSDLGIPAGDTVESLYAELADAKLQLKQVTKQRDKYKAALASIKDAVASL